MTLFVNLRGSAYGAVCDPFLIAGDPFATDPPAMNAIPWATAAGYFSMRHVVLVTHGFNVGYVSGLRSLARLEQQLALGPDTVFLGVLWPGDWVVPAINYPFAVGISRHAGGKLGGFCNKWLRGATSLSFVSHSLGARVILEAVQVLGRRARMVCVTAGAVNDDCLDAEYRAAGRNADAVQCLSSESDHVLAIAFPIGDIIGNILHDDHMPFRRALGRDGPTMPWPANVDPLEIPVPGYDHSDYLPPDARHLAPPMGARWEHSAAFIRRALGGAPASWS